MKGKWRNLGLGIRIVKDKYDERELKGGLEIGFEDEKRVVIEKLIGGRELRILMMNDEVVGMVEGVGGKVRGEGVVNMGEVIERKNEDGVRGKGYGRGLEKIRKGGEEEMFVKEEGMDLKSVGKEGEVVYVGEKWNMSRGGERIDFREDIEEW